MTAAATGPPAARAGRAPRRLPVIFTDLDGTLLDHRTYSARAALPALRLARARGVPVVPCTSKTFAETAPWLRRLGLHHPFVVENGGAIWIPRGYFARPPGRARRGRRAIELAGPRRAARAALLAAARDAGVPVLLFADLPAAEIARRTGLTPLQARRAREREYTEPFLPGPGRAALRLVAAAAARGLTLTRGGRFWHASLGADKGAALLALARLYRRERRGVVTVALGDGRNDFPMLRAADRAFLLRRPGERHERGGRSAGFALVPEPGPGGWNRAVLAVLREPGVAPWRPAAEPTRGRGGS